MTENDWLTGTDPDRLIGQLRGRASPRRWRLFACACARRVTHFVENPDLLQGLEVAERYADGRASEAELRKAADLVDRWLENAPPDDVEYHAGTAISDSLESDKLIRRWPGQRNPAVVAVAQRAEEEARDPAMVSQVELAFECAVLRDLFGNPFRIVHFDPTWRTWNDGAIVGIARRIYDEQAFDNLPILADALEEAGCTEADILAHCREPGVHVRGCWVLDWLLGRFRGDILYDRSLEDAAADFMAAFENVFHHDWNYARGLMNAPYFIRSDGTFLVPKVADEQDDWGTRGSLLQAYRVLRRVMEEKGIAPPPLGEPGITHPPGSDSEG
jgi:hypothetical protein